MTFRRVWQAPELVGVLEDTWFFEFTQLDCTNVVEGPFETAGHAYIALIHHPVYHAMRKLTQ